MAATWIIIILVALGFGIYDTVTHKPTKTVSPTYYRIYVRFADYSKPKTFYCREEALEVYKEWLSEQDISYIQFTEMTQAEAWKLILSGK